MPSIRAAYDWSVTVCNDPNVGYSQTYRNQQTVGGITYYDCSSFVWYALVDAGFDMIGAYNACYGAYSGNAMTTPQMDTILTWLGFTRYAALGGNWANGDIMWKEGHTEFVYDAASFYCMGAHTDQYPLADQVSISYASTRYYWTYGYRYAPTAEWHAKYTGSYGRWTDEAYANAVMIWRILQPRGWTQNAVAGMLGNMEVESGYNPWRWQRDNIIAPSDMWQTGHGYGLFQLDPPNKYINSNTASLYTTYGPHYLGNEGTPNDGDAQIKWMDDEVYGQYYPTSAYPIAFSQYRISTREPEWLALAWMRNFERPNLEIEHFEEQRKEAARYWYNVLMDLPPGPGPGPTPGPPYHYRKSPWWMYIWPF